MFDDVPHQKVVPTNAVFVCHYLGTGTYYPSGSPVLSDSWALTVMAGIEDNIIDTMVNALVY